MQVNEENPTARHSLFIASFLESLPEYVNIPLLFKITQT
jgi:hypothetical protein